MLRAICVRLAWSVVTLLGVCSLTFVVMNAMPGNAASQLLGIDATQEQVAQFETRLGLARPIWERYIDWLLHVLQGDLGESLTSTQPVFSVVLERLPISLELIALALTLSLLVAIPAALLCARYPHSRIDRFVAAASITGLSSPVYVLGLMLVFVFAVKTPLFPSLGFVPFQSSVPEHLRSLALPTITLAIPLGGLYMRVLRADLLHQWEHEHYIVAARAKGLAPWNVLVRHAFRNGSFGLLTLVGLNLGPLIGGTVIVEQVFAIPGLGAQLLQAVNLRDAPLVQGVVLIIAIVTLLSTLVVDGLYALLDPRLRSRHE